MSCNGACEHPGCNVRVPGTAPDARAFAVSGTPAAALEGCGPPIIGGSDFGGVNIVGCAAPFPHVHVEGHAGGDFAGMVVAGPSPVETFWGNLFGGRAPTMPAPNAMPCPPGFICERWRNDTDPVTMPPGGQVQRYQGWWRIARPAPRAGALPPRPKPGAAPKPKPTAKPSSAKPAARPPAKPAPPGMTCGPWRSDRAAVRFGATNENLSAPWAGWWRECRPKPAAPTKPVPVAPTPDAEEAKLCAMAPPDEIALTEPDVILWWLTCGERAEADVEALLFAMVAAGRDAEAEAIVAALSEGEAYVGQLPGWLRTADDAFSSVWDAVKEVVPYGGAIDTLHRARRGLMYGPEAAKPSAGRPAAGRGVGEAIREAQRLVRAARKGDAAATASITRAKEEASRNPEARRRWAVLVATMADHDKRVDALTEGRAPALVASAPGATTRAAPAKPAAGGGTGGGGFLGLLGGGARR